MSRAAEEVARAVLYVVRVEYRGEAIDASPPFAKVRAFVESDVTHRADCAKHRAMRDEADALRQFQRFQTTACDCGLDELRELFKEE